MINITKNTILSVVCLLSLATVTVLTPARVLAEIHKYTDENGATHYVDSIDKVPAEFRELSKDFKDVPGISKVKPAKKNLYDSSSGPKKNYSTSKSLEIFVADWCGYCRALEKDLKAEGIPFRKFNVETSAKGKQMWKKLGGGVPFSRVGGKQIIRGYALDKIKIAMGRK